MINENMIDVAEMIGSSYRQLQRVLRYFIKQEYMKKIDKGKYMILDNGVNLVSWLFFIFLEIKEYLFYL